MIEPVGATGLHDIRVARILTAVSARNRAIGRRIAAARKAAGLTQNDLAKILEKRQPQISDWERGRFEIETPNLQALARELKVTLAHLLDEPDANGTENKTTESGAGESRRDQDFHTAGTGSRAGVLPDTLHASPHATTRLSRKDAPYISKIVYELSKAQAYLAHMLGDPANADLRIAAYHARRPRKVVPSNAGTPAGRRKHPGRSA